MRQQGSALMRAVLAIWLKPGPSIPASMKDFA
jgi:hypothetical protein